MVCRLHCHFSAIVRKERDGHATNDLKCVTRSSMLPLNNTKKKSSWLVMSIWLLLLLEEVSNQRGKTCLLKQRPF